MATATLLDIEKEEGVALEEAQVIIVSQEITGEVITDKSVGLTELKVISAINNLHTSSQSVIRTDSPESKKKYTALTAVNGLFNGGAPLGATTELFTSLLPEKIRKVQEITGKERDTQKVKTISTEEEFKSLRLFDQFVDSEDPKQYTVIESIKERDGYQKVCTPIESEVLADSTNSNSLNSSVIENFRKSRENGSSPFVVKFDTDSLSPNSEKTEFSAKISARDIKELIILFPENPEYIGSWARTLNTFVQKVCSEIHENVISKEIKVLCSELISNSDNMLIQKRKLREFAAENISPDNDKVYQPEWMRGDS